MRFCRHWHLKKAARRWRRLDFGLRKLGGSVKFPSPSFRGARSASPESITTIGSMDSGPAPRGASRNDEVNSDLRRVHLQHAPADLVFLDRFKQCLEIALAKAIVALALDEFEEDRPDRI